MKGAARFFLIGLQWALVVLGLLLMLVSSYIFYSDIRFYAATSAMVPGRDYYIVPIVPRFIGGIVMGLCSTGIGAVLFYLRRLYLSRPSPPI